MMKQIRPLFRPCAGLLALAALVMPAMLRPASAQIEFGYKDRVFDQKYLLPDDLAQSQIMAASGMLSAVFMMNPALGSEPINVAKMELR